MTKYNQIGKGYNQTRKADPFITKNILEHLLPENDGIYLDIGCGTGNYTNEFQKSGYSFIGIDPSSKMIEVAKQRNQHINWSIGTAENTGLQADEVNGIVGTLTIHHWTDLEKGFSELYSVLKPKGRIVIFTSTPKQMKGYWLNHYFPKMLEDSIIQMPSFQRVENAMLNCGFSHLKVEQYTIHSDLEDKFLYCGKHNPELYFDKQIQQGISSFSSLANQEEVKQGLLQMREDISSGKITDVMNFYKNNLGDYMFIIGKKCYTSTKPHALP